MGTDAAFAAVVSSLRPELLRYARRLVGPDRGEDVVQSALMHAWESWATGAEVEFPRAWFFLIVKRTALNVIAKDREVSALVELMPAADDTISLVEARERLAGILQGLSQLPAVQRDSLILSAFEGLSYADVGERLAISEGAARIAAWRGRRALFAPSVGSPRADSRTGDHRPRRSPIPADAARVDRGGFRSRQSP